MSRTQNLRRSYFEAAAAALMVFALILGHVYLVGSGITVQYELYSNVTGETQVYWSVGEPLSEAKQSIRKVFADTRNDVRTDIAERSPIKLIRIDPLKSKGIFRIENIRIDTMATLLPLGYGRHTILKIDNAASIQQLEKRDAGHWEATGNDPYFLFHVPRISEKKILLLNLLSGLALVTATVLLTRLTASADNAPNPAREQSKLSMTAIGMYGVFLIFALLSSQFVRVEAYSSWVVYTVLVFWTVLYVLLCRRVVTHAFVGAIGGLWVIAIAIVLDFLFHFGVIGRPVFSLYDSPLYHWQLGKPVSDNFMHSSLRYYEDFRAIGRLIIPDSYFLSDVATSYYVSAALPLYAVNVLPHHRKSMVTISKTVLRNLCDENTKPGRDIIEIQLREKAELHEKEGMAPIRYLFLNSDRKNRHVASRCLSRRHELIRAALDPILTPVYEGKFIHVYEFRIQ